MDGLQLNSKSQIVKLTSFIEVSANYSPRSEDFSPPAHSPASPAKSTDGIPELESQAEAEKIYQSEAIAGFWGIEAQKRIAKLKHVKLTKIQKRRAKKYNDIEEVD